MTAKRINLSFTLNGRPKSAEAWPTQTALSFLREVMGMRSVKEGCGIGECGTCSIILDGRAVNACLLPAAKLDGRVVETTEGLANSDILHPLQESFIKHGAIQCGFCTPGLLMSAKALLDENPRPTAEEIRRALAGNLCRCGGYQQIVEAVLAVARPESGPSDEKRA